MQAIARAQPNIALIKYWGKRDSDRNLPAVGSISLTLAGLYTEMQLTFDASRSADELIVNGAINPKLLPRISRCIDTVAEGDRPAVRAVSRSNFPIAAGLASSASAFAATTVAASAALRRQRSTAELASLAGRASGSAARSLYGGFAELTNDGNDIRVRSLLSADEWPLRVVIAITEPGPKPIASGDAMEISRKTSPFYTRWVDDQQQDLDAARAAIHERNFSALANVSEHNCLKMHSLMWTSRPSVVYWNAATLNCLHTIRGLQAAGHSVFFTIDAGPQVKAVCLPDDAEFVRQAMLNIDGVSKVIVSELGAAARVVQTDCV